MTNSVTKMNDQNQEKSAMESFAFLIPLVSKKKAKSWDEVVLNLERTVQSINASESDNYLCLIAHDDKPDSSIWQHKNVVSVQLPASSISANSSVKEDKARKIKAAASWLQINSSTAHHYLMFLDADDLIDSRLVRFVLEKGNKQGYSITDGYVLDLESNLIKTILDNFHQQCGSCFIGYFRREELPLNYMDRTSVFSRIYDVKHKDHANSAIRVGKNIEKLPFPAVVYCINHINSAQQILTGNKRDIKANILKSPLLTKHILSTRYGISTGFEKANELPFEKAQKWVFIGIQKFNVLLIKYLRLDLLRRFL